MIIVRIRIIAWTSRGATAAASAAASAAEIKVLLTYAFLIEQLLYNDVYDKNTKKEC